MKNAITCGEATIRPLTKYGVDTVFGISGVHTLDVCRGLETGRRQPRAEPQRAGCGVYGRGFARATGKPGVALVISGPEVTNAATAVGQCYADALPMLRPSPRRRATPSARAGACCTRSPSHRRH